MPGVLAAGVEEGWLVLEWVGGRTVRRVLDGWAHQVGKEGEKEGDSGAYNQEEEMLDLMRRVGAEVGKLHNIGVCHGDLTTSNLMLSPCSSTLDSPLDESLRGNVYLIDFGLTSASIQDEDKAVDLYVLERAFAATHPAAEPLFQEVLRASTLR